MDHFIITKKEKPPYWIGILCFIPLLGAMAGFVILILAIVKYKDKWFALIGAAGIIITIGVYASLFYYVRHSGVIKNGFEQISRSQLNSLLKNVEFYKIQHGSYPASLKDLLKDDPTAPIHDAIQMNQGRSSSTYNYYNYGDRYRLFSSGQDGVPNTADDIFPFVTGDSGKLGLIR